jgi:type IX secretion system PorP/SprF family membrane protein
MALCFQGFAQQHTMYTQYMFNGLALNPAYAGSHGALSLTALAREQWAGLEGAPSTQTFAIHGPIKNKRIALGMVLLRDQIGVSKEHSIYSSYAYRISMDKGTLSMGLQVGFTSYREDLNELLLQHRPAADFQDVKSSFLPNFGAGLFYSSERFYAGFSVPRMLQNSIDKDNPVSTSKEVRHYFLTGGYMFYLSKDLKLKPNFLLKVVEGAPIQFDLNANLLIRDLIWVGLSHRFGADWNAILELQVSNRLRIGYAYDFANSNDLSTVQSGSHEFMVNYVFSKPEQRMKSPRFF